MMPASAKFSGSIYLYIQHLYNIYTIPSKSEMKVWSMVLDQINGFYPWFMCAWNIFVYVVSLFLLYRDMGQCFLQ